MTEQPIPIRDQRWPEGIKPVVSIFCITYNHEKFIRDAIEGFLMQETTFPVEIFVHDDASKDGTQAILKEYQEKYPRLFRMVLQKENQWSKKGNKHFFELLNFLNSKYIAMCEGDDFWTSKSKLQKQVNFLENHESASGCFHQVKVINTDGDPINYLPNLKENKTLFLRDILTELKCTTCSIIFKNNQRLNLSWANGLLMGDWPLIAELASKGPIISVKGNYGCYRFHPNGLWSGRANLEQRLETEKFFCRAFDRFREQIKQENIAAREKNLLEIFQQMCETKRPAQAAKIFIKAFLISSNKRKLFKNRKRDVLYSFSLGTLQKK